MDHPSRLLSLAFVSALLAGRHHATAQAPTDGGTGIAWQRSAADAFAVQKATGLPLLVVVNMDGEVFNERFAKVTYKDADFVALTRGYVCVVCSPDRHTERDYDAHGNRIECPRFPGCTCSEHIQIEPGLYERFFNGSRNAPRHLGISPDGKVLFDRFLDQSMQTAIDAIRKHRGTPKEDTAAPEDLAKLFQRRDAGARRALEQRFRSGDEKVRAALLTAAAAATNEPTDLLRMALRDDDDRTFALAALALARIATKDHTIDVEDALARTDDPAVTSTLVACLQRLGEKDKAAAKLARHLEPRDRAGALPAPWSGEWRAPAFDANDRASLEAELDRCEAALKATPDDDDLRLRLATAQAAFAEVLIRDGGKGIEFWLEDAVRSAQRIRAEALRAEVHGLLGHVHWLQNDLGAADGALRIAFSAPAHGRKPDPWLAAHALATQVVLAANAVLTRPDDAANQDLRPALDRTLATLDLFAAHGGATEPALLAASGLLEFAGLRHEARVRLAQAVRALPGSERLHERWRNRLMVDLGAEAMRRRYATFVDEARDAATAQWFAGFAAIVAAERHTQEDRRDVAALAYTEAIDRFAKSGAANETYLDSANHFTVLALAGRAHLRLAGGDAEGAVADLTRAAALRPQSLDDSDGLQRKPRGIASRVARELESQGKAELATKLKPLLP